MLNSPLVGTHGAFFSSPNKPKVFTSSSLQSSPQFKQIPLKSLGPSSPLGYYCPKPKDHSPLKGRAMSRNSQLDEHSSIYIPTSPSKTNLQLNTSYGNSGNPFKLNEIVNLNIFNAAPKNRIKLSLETSSSAVGLQKVPKGVFNSNSSARLRNVVTPTLPKERILEKWPPISLQNSPNTTMTNSFLFMENKKKFQIKKVPNMNQVARENIGGGTSALEQIKRNVKLQGLKKYRPTPGSKTELKDMGEILIIKKSGEALTKEEEVQVRLLRKKVEISKVFGSKHMDEEDKKTYYRNLLLEFHPDKCKHDTEFSNAMFHFLQCNKERFLI